MASMIFLNSKHKRYVFYLKKSSDKPQQVNHSIEDLSLGELIKLLNELNNKINYKNGEIKLMRKTIRKIKNKINEKKSNHDMKHL